MSERANKKVVVVAASRSAESEVDGEEAEQNPLSLHQFLASMDDDAAPQAKPAAAPATEMLFTPRSQSSQPAVPFDSLFRSSGTDYSPKLKHAAHASVSTKAYHHAASGDHVSSGE
jgi:hypothetical protein